MRPHQKLIAWQSAIDLLKEIYIVTMNFPETEKFGIISQLRRAAVSVPTNIAEGAARNSIKEFIHFNYISLRSISEIDTLLILSKNLNILNDQEYFNLLQKNEKVSAVLNGPIKHLKSKLKTKTT